MALLNPTFILAVLIVVYLSSFVLFAILRILTGISIQRIGYFSLKRVTYSPKVGIDIEIRCLGLNLHRPTFAQPTWLSIVLTELAIVVDLNATGRDNFGDMEEVNGIAKDPTDEREERPMSPKNVEKSLRGKSWIYLTSIKERIKRLHRDIKWIRMVDLVATNSMVTFVDVGNIQVGSFTIGVDTRRKMVDRERMFSRPRTPKKQKRPAEWIITIRSVLFTAESRDPFEILDYATLNIHGLLYKDLDGLRDASISLKLGRVNLRHDDIMRCIDRYNSCCTWYDREVSSNTAQTLVADLNESLENSLKVQEERLAQTVSDSKGFLGSILRGIKEVQFAVSFVGFTKEVSVMQSRGAPIYLSVSMKEVGIDLHRLDQKSPAHRMYFSSKDIAHQALVAALSIEIGVDDGHGKTERLIYIPMATTTVRTTLPSKTMELVGKNSADERNANIVFANVVITSPSVDLDPINLALVLSIMQQQPRPTHKLVEPQRQRLMSWLLPKASVKFSMHEPVLRIALPPVEKNTEDDFDLIISSISSVSLDIESSHSAVGELHYCLGSTFRLQSHALYYQTSSGTHHELLETESLELKAQISARHDFCVAVTGNLQTCSIHMIRPEINDGIRQIVRQLHLIAEPENQFRHKSENIIRTLPPWLVNFSLQGSHFRAEAAGIDEEVSDDTRGVALQLESWTVEYCAQKLESSERKTPRKCSITRPLDPTSDETLEMPMVPGQRKMLPLRSWHPMDGRQLSIHVKGLEIFIVESARKWESHPFVEMPEFEGNFFTTSDSHGPVFDITLNVKSLLIHYSLYRHYAYGVAIMIVRRAFLRTQADQYEAEKARATSKKLETNGRLSPNDLCHPDVPDCPYTARELITFNLKAKILQVKAKMPSDPVMMLSVYGIEAGRRRWAPPFFISKFARLYAEAPRIPRVWTRIVCIKSLRINHREIRCKKKNGETIHENLLDINSEAIHLAIPHQFIVHQVVDNFINTLKSVQQLHHRFLTGLNQPMPEKCPQNPKELPRILIRSNALLFEIEDGAFEWKLGVIYRTGLVEQAQRLARSAAFDVKEKKIEEETRKDSSKYRNRSVHQRSRAKNSDRDRPRSVSPDDSSLHSDQLQSPKSRQMRYNPDGNCGITSSAKISAQEAFENLQIYNAQSWKRRIDRIFSQTKARLREMQEAFWGTDGIPADIISANETHQISERPALMEALISNFELNIEKPSFPLDQLPDFINRIGKGMPYDMQYSLLVPMHVQFDMGEARLTLRDYPLPLLHVPPVKQSQSTRLPAWSLKADFVIAEEVRSCESTRLVKVDIVPPNNLNSSTSAGEGFSIDVRRTISPVKSYSDIDVCINTGLPTRITWGSSFQPAIQDMMMIIETFTKPQIDPSDRAGFWDKIRLSFHSRVSVAWKGDGDVHLLLKGTRDPYAITGNGAGFLMCWRNDVRWNICRDDDPRKFMTVDSGEYILAIPDLSHHARSLLGNNCDGDKASSSSSLKRGTALKKVVMKLSGNVRWLAGLMFERNLAKPGQRSFEFTPHYNVIFKRPECAKSTDGLPYDAFRGFRSNHIHLSIAVKAPIDRKISFSTSKKSISYNAVHLTPRFFSHFFAWWSMFGGAMSLPIRQGALWPGIEKSSKKFARHVATIKYNLLLAPLFISHIYKHNDTADYNVDEVSATGLKIKLDRFMLDVHQRREDFPCHDKGRTMQGKTSGMKMHQAQLDLLSADIRAITASIAETTTVDLKSTSVPAFVFQHDQDRPDLSNFEIPDNDFNWIDIDDFVELDWILPSDAKPETKFLPLAYAPRLTYSRRTDSKDTISGDIDKTSFFGHEPTHFCVMTQDDDPRRVQYELIKNRMEQLERQIKSHSIALDDAELKICQDSNDETFMAEVEQLKKQSKLLREKNVFLKAMMSRMAMSINTSCSSDILEEDSLLTGDREKPLPKNQDSRADPTDNDLLAEARNDFSNRFVIHNMQLKWNNLLRNIILRYIHQVRQRRGVVYYLSRRAVKFIIDIVQEQKKPKPSEENTTPSNDASSTTTSASGHGIDPVYVELEDRINEILSDCKEPDTASNKCSSFNSKPQRVSADNLNSNISEEFVPVNSYYLYLIAPQIQLQSEKNPRAVVLVAAKGMEAKVVEVMDKDRIFDKVSGLVQRRFSVEMDSIQFFVTHRKWFSSQLLSMYSGNRYGAPVGSTWPPWVPMEIMFDFDVDPFGFKRVVHKTSASLRYDKYNTLRLKDNDEVSSDSEHGRESRPSKHSRMDHLRVEFPQIRAICNSAQYYAMYIIVMDLLMYSEPLEKTRSERLEKIMLAADFSDLRGVPEMVTKLQERIRQLDEIKTYFQINSQHLDTGGREDLQLLDRDYNSCANELFFMMEAIKTSQRKFDPSKTSGLLRWNISSQQIVWHLIHGNNEPLLEFQLQKAVYDRTDNSDGSHINIVQVSKITGLNLLPDAIYPEIFAPYLDIDGKTFNEDGKQKMLRVYWFMLEAIAGIPVMDHFEVNLFPMKIQLDRDIGKKLFDYIFPGSTDSKNKSPFLVRHMQPVYDDADDDDAASSLHSCLDDFFAEKPEPTSNTGTRAFEHRLKPTLTSEPRVKAANKRPTSIHSPILDGHQFRLFPTHRRSPPSSRGSSKGLRKKISSENINTNNPSRPPLRRSLTVDVPSSNFSDVKNKRFSIGRGSSKSKNEQVADDLTKMMGRASSYMALAYVKIPSVVLCLSYKGKGERNLEDIHNLVFRLPDIEYRNKTWSNLDLALAFKKDVIRTLISHTGAIVANKFKHRPNTAQQHRQRELATSSMILTPSSEENSFDNSDATSSIRTCSQAAMRSERSASPKHSFVSRHSSFKRKRINASCVSHSKNVPNELLMTSLCVQPPFRSDQPAPDANTTAKPGSVLGILLKRSDSMMVKNERPAEPTRLDDAEGNSKKKYRSLKTILGTGV